MRSGDFEGADEILRAWKAGLAPDPTLTVSEWSDRHRILSSRSASEAGPYRTARTPFMREIMDALSPSHPARRVVFMKSAQVGATEAGNNWIGYIVDVAPGPILAVQATVEMAKGWSKQRLADMVAGSERLRERIADSSSRRSDNTLLSKSFPGGAIYIAGANSPAGLKSKPIRFVFLDEVDSYPPSAGAEGDPCDLAVARTQAFKNAKVLFTSTCTVRGESKIEAEYLATDQRKFFVPCPECGEFQILEFKNLVWPKGQPHAAEYVCPHCGSIIEERKKPSLLRAGEWRPTAEGPPKVRGYWLSSFYSPFLPWGVIAQRFVQAKGDPGKLQVVVNTLFAETWDAEDGETLEGGALAGRTEDYPAEVPNGVGVLTAGVDVQADRLEVSVWGWGLQDEAWVIEHRILYGDPMLDEVWDDLDAVLETEFRHESGHKLKIASMAVDSGYATDRVYAWCGPKYRRGVYATKGREGPLPVWPVKQSKAKGGRYAVRILGVDTGKGHLYSRLKVEDPGPGFVHFPRKGLPSDYFKQLVVEKRKTRYHRGQAIHYWHKPDKARNEALDCAVYAYAALLAWRARGGNLDRELDKLTVKRGSQSKPKQKAPAKPRWLGARPRGWLSR